MRLGYSDLSTIKRKILTDLYGMLEEDLNKRKKDIAKQNREKWLDQYRYLLDQLPQSMVTRHEEYRVKIVYTPNGEDVAIDEEWYFSSDKPIINPVDDSSHYAKAVAQPLHADLQADAAALCNSILALKKERDQMKTYLDETTTTYKGSLQLKKVWDESLHKYLPAEPVKIKKPKQEEKAFETPTFLKDRMTTNLLEGN